ncbi:MAG: efflux RND transporter periplasmic adaptor subunit [Verrucomicrobia bacterium]|nr:efflux RND transporter periplasmic adaptor subunit [Verrucomicrobiota bacterium]
MSVSKGSLDELRIERGDDDTGRAGAWLGWGSVLAVLLAAALFGWFRLGRSVEVRTVVLAPPDPAEERVLLNASGYVTARRAATVSSKVTGKVTEVRIEEGTRVEAGQVLAQLDDANTKASLKLAEAQLRSAQVALAETRVRLDEAEKELARISNLVSNRVASASDLDRAEAEVKSRQAQLEKQTADISVAEHQVALWQQQLDDTTIRAPFAGVVTTKNAQPGEMISPVSAGGGFTRTGIGTIVDMTSLEIEVDVNESYLNRVRVDQPVEATLDAYQDWKIPAHVIAVIPTADREKSTVKVRVGFDQLDPRILPEMAVKVAFLREGEPTAAERLPLVPAAAVQADGDQRAVWVVQEGKAAKRLIQTGDQQERQFRVLAGLNAGDRVVVEGQDKLRKGQRVREMPR